VIAGIGLDAASVPKTGELIARFGERFTRRVFTRAERRYCDSRAGRAAAYAARFAAKEAVMKVLGSGWGSGVRFVEIEVTREERGRPGVKLTGGAEARAREMGITKVLLAITHEEGLALAAAVGEMEKGVDSRG
jgi:holo-[acyl-carrier protein] synthase